MRVFILPVVICFLSACNAGLYGPANLESFGELEVQSAVGNLSSQSFPVAGTRFVSFHADRVLRRNRSCTQILKLRLVQKLNYMNTIVELKNRAILMGGNAVSLVNWRESSGSTGLVGNIYICKNKSYHIHPHPG